MINQIKHEYFFHVVSTNHDIPFPRMMLLFVIKSSKCRSGSTLSRNISLEQHFCSRVKSESTSNRRIISPVPVFHLIQESYFHETGCDW